MIDIAAVIDFCLVKELSYDMDTNYQCLRLNWASKASLIQRKGVFLHPIRLVAYLFIVSILLSFWQDELVVLLKAGATDSSLAHSIATMLSPIAPQKCRFVCYCMVIV